jgi:hypothetical protein
MSVRTSVRLVMLVRNTPVRNLVTCLVQMSDVGHFAALPKAVGGQKAYRNRREWTLVTLMI